MPNNPDFVRLSDHMVNGLVVDMDTGWSLSGYDVAPFPESSQQAKFVRRKINAGVLETASQAEYDEAHPEGGDVTDEDTAQAESLGRVLGVALRGGGGQEHVLRERESGRHEGIKRVRAKETLRSQGVDVDDDDDQSLEELEFAEEEARLAAIADEQDEADLSTDDAEEQKDRTATRAPAGAKKTTAKKAAGSRKRS